jgi:hypothetical protein
MQQWLQESAYILRYTYISCLVLHFSLGYFCFTFQFHVQEIYEGSVNIFRVRQVSVEMSVETLLYTKAV